MARVLSAPELYTFTGGGPPGVHDLRARYERLVAGGPDPGVGWHNWVIHVRSTRRLAGTVQATVVHPAPPHQTDGAENTGGAHGTPHPRGAGAAGAVTAVVGTNPEVTAGTANVAAASAEIAWVVGAEWQRRGFATEAAHGLVGWLRRHGITRIVAHVHPAHHASAGVASAVGLRPTGGTHDGEEIWRLPEPPRPAR
ncbi:N-acetyltransferase [Streptomyces sp. AJS327]|nr:N-acetyltransferase [Streptomyces sp. AJS327]